MKLDLGFRAETAEEAQELAEQWIAAEPNVEVGDVVLLEAGAGDRWTVTVELVMHSDYVQESLGLA